MIGLENLMPAQKLKPQKLQCPHCATISTRGTGLSSHIRTQHPKEYARWNRNPNRLLEAAAAASSAASSPKDGPAEKHRARVAAPAPRKVEEAAPPPPPAAAKSVEPEVNGDKAQELLQKAYEQLTARKQNIEADLARIEALRQDQEVVNAQLAALDQAMKAFQPQQRKVSKAS